MHHRRLGQLLLVIACFATLGRAQAQHGEAVRAALACAERVDRAVGARLQALGLTPAPRCSDAVFLRRLFLDVIGTLPRADDVRTFCADTDRDKRCAWVERLLARREFVDYMAMRWSDVLRVKSEFPINLWPNASQAYYQWIWTAIHEQLPYDRFATQLLTASGSNFRAPAVNFYRALQSRTPETMAQATALAFLGARTDQWPAAKAAGLAHVFARLAFKSTSEWKEEIVYFDALQAPAAAFAELPDGSRIRMVIGEDPRWAFASWLTRPQNPWFTRNAVNRVWYWLLGRGIIHEPDDLRADNPPQNEDLLAVLERELVRSRYDLRQIFRAVLYSATYQRAAVPSVQHPVSAASFASYAVRRLEAEVLIDAICQVTGTSESYSSLIPEPFTFLPDDQRAVALPDGSITSGFLEMFGRPARDTGLLSERNDRPTAAQRLHLLNSTHIQQKLERGSLLRRVQRVARRNARRAVDELYLTLLSRLPAEEDLVVLRRDVLRRSRIDRNTLLDLAWALINSAEFQYRH